VALEVGIVGLPSSGKTTLFRALTRAETHGSGKEHVGWRRSRTSGWSGSPETVGARKVTPAAVRVVDVPGTGPQLLGNLRQVDALLVVLDGFSGTRVPADDLETLKLELLVADRDHVERRLERVGKQAKSGDARLKAEVADLERLLAHLDAGQTLAEWEGELPPELEPLTTKPLLELVNGGEGIDLPARGGARGAVAGGGCRVPRRRRVRARRGRTQARGDSRPDHVLHGGGHGDARLDPTARRDRARRRRDDPLGHRARLSSAARSCAGTTSSPRAVTRRPRGQASSSSRERPTSSRTATSQRAVQRLSSADARLLAVRHRGAIRHRGGATHAKFSKETASDVREMGPVTDRRAEMNGYTVEFVSFAADADLDGPLQALPGLLPSVPTGVTSSRPMRFVFADLEEVYEAGDAYYQPPGHRPYVDAGTEILQFSPTGGARSSRTRDRRVDERPAGSCFLGMPEGAGGSYAPPARGAQQQAGSAVAAVAAVAALHGCLLSSTDVDTLY
jgi:hypothetical protein